MKKFIQYIPLALVLVVSGYSFFTGLFGDKSVVIDNVRYDVQLSNAISYGFVGALVVLLLAIFNVKNWSLGLTLLILLSFTPLVDFMTTKYTVILSGVLSINYPILGLLIFQALVNHEVLGLIAGGVNQDSQTSTKKEMMIKQYEQKLTTKSKEELQQIIDENRMLPEAIQAARNLICRK